MSITGGNGTSWREGISSNRQGQCAIKIVIVYSLYYFLDQSTPKRDATNYATSYKNPLSSCIPVTCTPGDCTLDTCTPGNCTLGTCISGAPTSSAPTTDTPVPGAPTHGGPKNPLATCTLDGNYVLGDRSNDTAPVFFMSLMVDCG